MLPKAPRKGLQGALLTVLVVVSFVLCVAGFLIVDHGFGNWRSWADAVYHSFRIFSFAYDGPKAPEAVPDALRLGRVGALISVLWASWMAGVALLRERASPLRLRLKAPAILFCGMTPDLLRIALSQRQASPRSRMALLVPDVALPLARRFRQEISGLVVAGNPADAKSLATCRVQRTARCVYIAGNTDAETIAITTAVATFLQHEKSRSQVLQIVAILRNRSLLQALPDILKNPDRGRIALNWVDPVIVTTRVLLDRLPPDSVATVQPIHVALLGSTALAEAILLQLARNAYPREQAIHVTLIASDAMEFRKRMFERHPALDPDFADRALFPGLHPLMVLRGFECVPGMLAGTDLAALDQPIPITCAYVVAGSDGETLLGVQRLQQLRALSGRVFPIAACLDEHHALDEVVTVVADRDVFNVGSGESYLGQHLDERAALHHYAYDQGRVPALTASVEEQRACEQAKAQWRTAAAWQRDSSRHVADHIFVKLRHLGLDGLASVQPFDLQQARLLQQRLLESLPQLGSIEHRRFCAERMLEGWLPVGTQRWNEPEASVSLKQHRERLKELKLNGTLTVQIDREEVAKDELLAASIAWVLWQAAHRPGAKSQCL